MSKPLAGKAELLASSNRRRFTTVTIGDDNYRLRSLTAREYSEVEALAMRAGMAARTAGSGSKNKQVKSLCDATALLIALAWVDDDGNLVLGRDELHLLADADVSVSQALAQACSEHCGIDAANLETLSKNSDATPSDDSLTD